MEEENKIQKEVDETIKCLCCYIREMAVMDVRRENFEHRKDIEKTTTALATLISYRAEKNTVINNTVINNTALIKKMNEIIEKNIEVCIKRGEEIAENSTMSQRIQFLKTMLEIYGSYKNC